MAPIPLTERESFILQLIYRKPKISQRELARATRTSLGLINILINRFIKNEYVKVSRINKRNVEYSLTPQGLAEATRIAFQATDQTIRNYNSIKLNLSKLLKHLQEVGYDYFSIFGDGELKSFVESALKLCFEDTPITIGNEHREDSRAIVLNVSWDNPPNFKGDVVNVIEKIGFSL